MTERPCSYVHTDGTKCKRTSNDDFDATYSCLFHRPLIRKNAFAFNEELGLLIDDNDGLWDGFIFPTEFKLENKSIKFPVLCRNATFQNIVISETAFHEPIDFEGAVFEGDLRIEASVVFHKSARFYNSRFMGKALFKGLFKGVANFISVVFSDSVVFRGHRMIVLKCLPIGVTTSNQKKIPKSNPEGISNEIVRVFNDKVEFTDVEFERPDRVKFHIVDLSKARVVGTLFRGVSFQDVLWNKRKGIKAIYDEVFGEESQDQSYIVCERPRLAETYRGLRVALEDNKDYSTASDFYVGEMEAVRKQKNFFRRNLFSIEAIYKLLSNYGTDPFRAITVLLLMILGHSFLTWLIIPNSHYVLGQMGYCSISSSLNSLINTIFGLLHNSFKIVLLQRFEPFVKYSAHLSILDTIFRVFGPIQIALIVLALRVKVKRH